MASLNLAGRRCLSLRAVSRLACQSSRSTAMQSALLRASTRRSMIEAACLFNPLPHTRVGQAASGQVGATLSMAASWSRRRSERCGGASLLEHRPHGRFGRSRGQRTGFRKGDQGEAAEADVGWSALDPKALVPAFETVGLDVQSEAVAAAAVTLGSDAGVRLDGADERRCEFNSRFRDHFSRSIPPRVSRPVATPAAGRGVFRRSSADTDPATGW